MTESRRRHLFISHHHADDAEVTKLTDLLKARGNDIRNSSIRAKPANQARLDRGLVSPEVIRRILRMKISWAGTVVVLIGKETHARPWVNWEIEEANRQGKRIVGFYERGGTENDIPPALQRYSSTIVGWNSQSMIEAIEGTTNRFELPGGSSRAPVFAGTSTKC